MSEHITDEMVDAATASYMADAYERVDPHMVEPYVRAGIEKALAAALAAMPTVDVYMWCVAHEKLTTPNRGYCKPWQSAVLVGEDIGPCDVRVLHVGREVQP